MLSGDVSLCSVFESVSLLRFPPPWHLRFCQRWLRCCFPTEAWGEAACQRWEELTVTCVHIISHTFPNFPARAHTHAHTNTCTLLCHTCTTLLLYTVPLTAWGGVDGLDIWSWLTRRENEGELHREEKRRKKRGRIWKREKGLVRQHVGRKQKEKIQVAKSREMRRGRGRQRSWAESPKKKMCERKVRHGESQLFPILFSHR